MLLFNDLEIGKSYIFASRNHSQIRLFKVLNKTNEKVIIDYFVKTYFSKLEKFKISKGKDNILRGQWETPNTIFIKHRSLNEDGTLQKRYLIKAFFQYI